MSLIQGIQEALAAAFQLVNLPFTILFLLMVGYWLLVILGFLDMEMSGGDVDVDVGAGAGAGGDLDADGLDADGLAGGAWGGVLSFLHLGHIPASAIFSVLILCLWMFSVLGNHYFNGNGTLLMAALLLIPNLLLSVVLTRYLVLPLRPLFRVLSRDYDAPEPIMGKICEVTTSTADDRFGQGSVETSGAPITIQIRTSKGDTLERGDKAVIVGREESTGFYEVRKFQEPV